MISIGPFRNYATAYGLRHTARHRIADLYSHDVHATFAAVGTCQGPDDLPTLWGRQLPPCQVPTDQDDD